jgi:hypothetical protein
MLQGQVHGREIGRDIHVCRSMLFPGGFVYVHEIENKRTCNTGCFWRDRIDRYINLSVYNYID